MNNGTLQRPKGFALVLHCLSPTSVGVIGYFAAGFAFAVGHLVALSLDGTAYPQHLDDELLMGYANFIIQPLLVLVNHRFVNSALTVVLWALAGSLVATVLGAIAGALNDWRNTRNDVSTTRYGVVIQHPLQQKLIMRLLWRLVIGATIIFYTIFVLLAVRYSFANDLQILNASTAEVARRFALSIAIWMAIFHGYVILLRLYVQRTRIFGEILY